MKETTILWLVYSLLLAADVLIQSKQYVLIALTARLKGNINSSFILILWPCVCFCIHARVPIAYNIEKGGRFELSVASNVFFLVTQLKKKGSKLLAVITKYFR